jgi:hypothetical protein
MPCAVRPAMHRAHQQNEDLVEGNARGNVNFSVFCPCCRLPRSDMTSSRRPAAVPPLRLAGAHGGSRGSCGCRTCEPATIGDAARAECRDAAAAAESARCAGAAARPDTTWPPTAGVPSRSDAPPSAGTVAARGGCSGRCAVPRSARGSDNPPFNSSTGCGIPALGEAPGALG